MNSFFSRFALALVALAALLCAPARAQNADLHSQQVALRRVGQALDRVVSKGKKVTGALDYGFMQGGCVFGVMLNPGATASETFPLKAGGSYVFIGGGDSTTRDVDISLSDGAGRVLVKDSEADASPFVLFKPKKSGTYKMTLRLKSAQSGKAFCAATVLSRGGAKLPIERIAQAAVKVGAASALIFNAAQGGQFNEDKNTWALYGVVLNSKQEAQSDYKNYRARNRVFVAVGDDLIKDLDLYLLDGNKKVVAGDNKNGQVAAVAYKTQVGRYSFAAQNHYSTGPSLVLGILLDLPDSFDINATAGKMSAPAPNNATASSKFAGQWQGEWADADGMQGGVLQIGIAPNGNLSGQLYNYAVDATVPVAGQVKPDGSFFFKYAYAGTSYIAKGTMQSDGNALAGRAGFSRDGQNFFSSGVFQLQRR